jgi:predicted ATP-grasp superfamily ATP-dependent carboligase
LLEAGRFMSKTIVVTGARAPAALHLARVFHSAGHRVILADTFRYPMSRATRMKDSYVRLPSPRQNFSDYSAAVAGLVAREAPDLVVPTCEEVFFLAAIRDRRGIGFPLFAPHFDLLARVHNKADFAQLAAGLGADPPLTLRLSRREDLSGLPGPVGEFVFKPAWSRFGSRVLIKPSEADVAKLRPTETDPWVAQSYLPGEEISAYAVATDGRLTAFQAYKPTYRVGHGAGVAFESVDAPAAQRFVAGLVTRLNWTGQISFDFRHDEDGELHVIECNPRATSGVHYFGPQDGLAHAFLDGATAQASSTGSMTLPLAMLAYGLPHAWRHRGLARWRHDFATMQDISSWPGDRGLLWSQFRALGEIAVKAVREGRGLIEASVRDIEWDGEPLS